MNRRKLLGFGSRLLEALRIPLALAPVAAALVAAQGCGSVACLEWSAESGPCPSREEALKRFGGQSCVADILAVDSDAVSDETACCYDVTKRASGDPGCGIVGGLNPTGGTTVGSSGSGGSCGGCGELQAGEVSDLCEPSVAIFNELVACLCSGACAEACDDGSCSTTADSEACQACASDPESGCGLEQSACANDI